MRYLPLQKLVLALSSILVTADSAYALTNEELLKLIYTKIVASIDLRKSEFDTTSNKYFFVLTQPGIFIDPKLLTAEGKEDSGQKRVFSEIIDRVMQPSWVYIPEDQTYYEYYKLILNSYEYKPLPISDDLKKSLAEAHTLLYTGELDKDGAPKTTSKYSTYLALQQKYLNALGDSSTWLNTHPGAASLPLSVSTPIKNAMNAWVAAGNKTDIENALETITRYDVAGYWSDVRTRFDRTTEETSLHLYYPSVATWLDKTNVWPSLSVGWSENR